jgi:hypothetical protein
MALAFDTAGNLYIADYPTSVRVVNAATGIITTYAGPIGYQFGFSGNGGPATSALLYSPVSLAFDSKNSLYIAEYFPNDVRMVDANGIISTYAEPIRMTTRTAA